VIQPGKYIVIEGNDGTGKSTQVGLMREKLKAHGIDSIEFHEPEGTPIATAIRTVIKNGDLERDGTTNLLLFSAARHDIWFNYALPAMKLGKWVVASRNYYSTLAYQGYGEGLDLELIGTTTRIATDDQYLRPDVAVILSLDDTERQKRIGGRGELDNPDTFESKGDGFQQRVNQGYLEIAASHNIPIVPANGSVEEVSDAIWPFIEPEL
jgi:dTMP kinase